MDTLIMDREYLEVLRDIVRVATEFKWIFIGIAALVVIMWTVENIIKWRKNKKK